VHAFKQRRRFTRRSPRSLSRRQHTRFPAPSAACVVGAKLAIIASVKNAPIKAVEADDLPPGAMTCVEMGGRRILVANIDGTFYATDDTCTHEDASLSSGSLTGELVKCPLHGSRFSLRTGEPMEDPAEEPLRCYSVTVDDGVVLVAFQPPAET
jgi:3-phenylpropionate/trans-cinnamate dioxygenase ferredoxin subunit